jgi:hypothetical protein
VAGIEEELLRGRWVHANEEDTGDELVLRPADHPLPRSRGRTSFEFRPDGTYTESHPGPVDVPEQATGRWSVEGDQLALEAESDAPARLWTLKSAEADRLTFRTG